MDRLSCCRHASVLALSLLLLLSVCLASGITAQESHSKLEVINDELSELEGEEVVEAVIEADRLQDSEKLIVKSLPVCDTAASAARGRWVDVHTYVSNDECVPASTPSHEELLHLLRNLTVYALGDSQTMRCGSEFSALVGGDYVDYRTSGRCDTLQNFFDLKPFFSRKTRGPGMGPSDGYPINHPGCSGMAMKDMIHFHRRFTSNNLQFIMLPCEFAKDVELANVSYNTTQETIFRGYVAKHHADIIFINNGVHDAMLATVEEYTANLRWQIDLMDDTIAADTHIVFWSSPTPLGHKGREQTAEFMDAVARAMEALVAQKTGRFHFLDTRYLGTGPIGKALHADNIHLKNYSMLIRLFCMLIKEVFH